MGLALKQCAPDLQQSMATLRLLFRDMILLKFGANLNELKILVLQWACCNIGKILAAKKVAPGSVLDLAQLMPFGPF